MTARLGILATAVNAGLTLAPQLVALVLLAPSEFGKFSIVYLLFAWGASLQLSVVCETIARVGGGGAVLGREFRAAAMWLAVLSGLLAGAVGQAVWGSALLAVLGGASVAMACFRVATRYGALVTGDWSGALVTDLAGLCLFAVVCAGGLIGGWSSPVVVLAAWCAASIAVVVVGPSPVLAPPSALSRWVRARRMEIVPLLKDSIVLDASSIGTPYLLAPILGFASFGVYRGLSNVAAPVRLLIEPLRPAWAVMDAATLPRVLRRVSLLVAVPLGIATVVALLVVARLPWQLGVLTALSDWALAAGAFVTLSMVSHIYYISARLHAPAEVLWRGRLAQSGSAIALPLAGAALGGLPGAIWAFVLATAVGAIVWVGRSAPGAERAVGPA